MTAAGTTTFPELLEPKEVMSILKIKKTKFYKLYHTGELHGSRLGGGESDIRVYASSVLEMLERNSNRKTPQPEVPAAPRTEEPPVLAAPKMKHAKPRPVSRPRSR